MKPRVRKTSLATMEHTEKLPWLYPQLSGLAAEPTESIEELPA